MGRVSDLENRGNCSPPPYPPLFPAGVAIAGFLLFVACNRIPPDPTQPPAAEPETPVPTLTLLGAMTGEQQRKLELALEPFVEETGIRVIYQGTHAFTTLLPVRYEAGKLPDIAIFPQPGLMADYAGRGQLVPLDKIIDRAQLAAAYPPNWLELGGVNGKIYGIWYRASVKSLVWYDPQAFRDAGYTVPATWDELQQLSRQIIDDGNVPWCLGMESGDATGWVGTDWIEDIILRTSGPEIYDRWVKHDIPFTHPAVRDAFETFGNIALDPKSVVGGTLGVLAIPFDRSPDGLFTDPPQCYLHRQASFISNYFPEGVVLGEDADIFPLPPIDEEFGLPILVGGDVVSMFRDTPEARKLMRYLASPTPHQIWAELGGYLSPHQGVSPDTYPDEVTRKQAEILSEADAIRFDASDMMPGVVGTGTFWNGITDYVEGEDLDTVLEQIDRSWPESSR
ncbi:ABC transporter substrate-binding protein [Lyngbya sp. CCY1209]|uniref:ABC transporter substrate-binding protein n=1 Tax=Lyngbya sp. CCY1209 TaxID=2886103 RepID=UPI002D200D77|nr:ABC transporter substrate-binding protein [Lyngbya sp. CCY1209]MEB3884243.1 ABC transporter substrate-binding protein [Lyngbya sp. CCY1209]